MPMVYTHYINQDTRLGVWHLAEKEDYFLKSVTIERDITHAHKRLQHLAGRYLLKELFEDFPISRILISATRKPYIENGEFQFSISHCGDYAAAIVSRSHKVGVDIEVPQQKIQVISHKFLSDIEKDHFRGFAEGPDHLTICWSIKEAVFKWYGKGKVDFKKHIGILSVDVEDNEYTALVRFSAGTEFVSLPVNGLKINGNWLSWIATEES